MTPSLRNRFLQELPPWHQQPLYLTVAEMEDPHAALAEFFTGYHLTDIRFCLREWLSTSLRRDEVPQQDYLALHDHLVKLAEAAWLLHQQQRLNLRQGKKSKAKAAKTKDKQ
jgi:hypothetical protein